MTTAAPIAVAAKFPARGTTSEKFRFLLQYAIRAPSSHNSQPWLFAVNGTCLELHADRSRALPVVDPHDRELTMSCGAALFLLRSAMRHYGRDAVIGVCPEPDNPDLLARVSFGDPVTAAPEDDELFDAIPRRRTNRERFEARDVPRSVLDALQLDATVEGAWMQIVEQDVTRDELADQIAKADQIQASDERFRRELAAWVHPNRSRSNDGIPGYAVGLSDLQSRLGRFVIRTFDWGGRRAAKDRQIAIGSPVLAVIGTEDDTPVAWVNAGQALARVTLRAVARGISSSYLNQPIEVPELRERVRHLLDRDGHPQIILRMGYGPAVEPTPRRPVDEVVR